MSKVLLVALLSTQVLAGGQAVIEAGSRSGGRLLPLISGSAEPGESCTSDRRWCVLLAEPDEDGVVRPVVRTADEGGADPQPPPDESSEESHAIWPALVTLEDGSFLAGVETRTGTSYSGGGGSATELRLFHVSPDGTAGIEPVFNAPLQASLMIRACFSERDMRRRRGACHDEYSFSGRGAGCDPHAAGRPILTYTTEAWAFPRGVARSGDSTQMRALRQGDLVRQRDAACSFTRSFRFDAKAGAYRPDMPLPECSDYTIP
jgi:hypothetical protein